MPATALESERGRSGRVRVVRPLFKHPRDDILEVMAGPVRVRQIAPRPTERVFGDRPDLRAKGLESVAIRVDVIPQEIQRLRESLATVTQQGIQQRAHHRRRCIPEPRVNGRPSQPSWGQQPVPQSSDHQDNVR